ncbi:MAG: hypothetical protein MUC57_04560 [Desulfobacterales bacterium]|jgi:hypothetical protein|nr:hypothetical protein [Desulfobacterales bacterium]
MSNSNRIIEEYHQADFGKRLSLFLDHPALRDEFIEIDLGEHRPAKHVEKAKEAVMGRPLPSRWLTVVANCCLKFKRT